MRTEKMSRDDFKKAQRVANTLDSDLKKYLKGEKQLKEIEESYNIDHKTLVSRIERLAIESEEWRKLYSDFKNSRKKSYKEIDFVPKIVEMIINERSLREEADSIGMSVETFKGKVNSISEDDELYKYIVEHKDRRKSRIKLGETKKLTITNELLEYLERRNGIITKLTEEQYIEEANRYRNLINKETGKKYTMVEIARILGISTATLRRYYSNMDRKNQLNESLGLDDK